MVDLDLPEGAPEETVTHELRKAGIVKRLAGGAAMVQEDARALDAFAAVLIAPEASVAHYG
eukprot:7082561-Alexandrium_andersonii.AAC.1